MINIAECRLKQKDKVSDWLVNIVEHLAAKEKNRAKSKVNIWLTFIGWPETRLQMNANVAPFSTVLVNRLLFANTLENSVNTLLNLLINTLCVCLLAWSWSSYVHVAVSSMSCSDCPPLHSILRNTLEKASQTCWLFQQVKVMYPALAYCSVLIALCSSRPIDFMISWGSRRLIRLRFPRLCFFTTL